MKHKGHHDIDHPEKQRDSEDGPPCLTHSETKRKELVVDVPLVRMERALTVPDTREEDTENIKHMNKYDRNRIYEKLLAHACKRAAYCGFGFSISTGWKSCFSCLNIKYLLR